MQNIARQVVAALMEVLSEVLPKEKVKELVDKALDKVESAVEKSGNKWDDAIVLPLITALIREPFGIEDNDGQVVAPKLEAKD